MDKSECITESLKVIKCSECEAEINANASNKKFVINSEDRYEALCDDCFWDAIE